MASVYCTDHCSYLDRGYLCGAENRSQGSSMETTLSDKDQLIVDKMTYRFRDPKRLTS